MWGHASGSDDTLQDFAYNRLYVARTIDLVARNTTGILCTRKKCSNKINCGFVPNYPIINFDPTTNLPTNNWVPIENAPDFFRQVISQP